MEVGNGYRDRYIRWYAPVAAAVNELAEDKETLRKVGVTAEDIPPPEVVLGIIMTESRGNPDTIGDGGKAHGLLQLHERAVLDVKVIPYSQVKKDPVANIKAGILYLARLMHMFGDVDAAVVAYNRRPTYTSRMIRKYGGDIPRAISAMENANSIMDGKRYHANAMSHIKAISNDLASNGSRVPLITMSREFHPPMALSEKNSQSKP